MTTDTHETDDEKGFAGEVTEVRKHVSPNDTTMDNQSMHKIKVDGDWYFWESHPHDSRTGATVDIRDEDGSLIEVPIKGSYVEGESHRITGRRGEKHWIVDGVDVREPPEE